MNHESFDATILPHLDAAYNLARWLLRGSDDADDVVQEACLRAFKYFRTFRGGNARAWLLSIVRTTAFRWLEKHRAQQLSTEFNEGMHSDGQNAPDPEAMMLRSQEAGRLHEAMNSLPDRLREVLVLREMEGLSYKEIAEIVDVPMGTVMSSLFRARERFRQAASDLSWNTSRARRV
jgi:RNA polymerase sigma-70 factor (ECF subfamily)